MMDNSAMGVFRPGKYNPCIVAAAVMMGAISGCQGLDATKTDSVFIKPVVHSVRSTPRVQPVQARFFVRSLRIEPSLELTSTIRTTETAYAYPSPQPITVRTPDPLNVSFNSGDDGAFPGSSPYICSPSGFGQQAACHARF